MKHNIGNIMPSSTDTNKRLKKGILWSKEEDEILKAYVEKHGTRNWKEVSKNTGLAHCGNSCRFRWCNTLRPDVKKGPFSKEEEEKFFELYSKFGEFRWSMMALEVYFCSCFTSSFLFLLFEIFICLCNLIRELLRYTRKLRCTGTLSS